jgi:hypothetical protein
MADVAAKALVEVAALVEELGKPQDLAEFLSQG